MGWAQYLIAAAIVVVCTLLVIIILLQKGRGGGLTAAFGGGGSGSAFGAKTGDVFTWITVTFVGLYLLLNVIGNFVFRQTIAAPPPGIAAPTESTAEPTDTPAQSQVDGQADQPWGEGDVGIDIQPVVPGEQPGQPSSGGDQDQDTARSDGPSDQAVPKQGSTEDFPSDEEAADQPDADSEKEDTVEQPDDQDGA